MKRIILLIVTLLTNAAIYAQSDLAGSGRAISFDGIDDYIDLGNIYDDLTYPFTVSVWVKTSPTVASAPILVTQDNAPLYNGFWFLTNANTFFIEYGDGRGEALPAYRRGKSSPGNAGEWVHLCAVVKARDNITMYYNGVDAGGEITGESNLPMASNYPGDVCKIGFFKSNGVTYRFKGLMDELRLFNRALTANEIRKQMCIRLKGNEPGLIGYWNFDETSGAKLLDLSSNHFDGNLQGNPQRVYSGAPVGNKSVFLYPGSWTSTSSLTMNEGADELMVNDVKGNPYGVHIYQVTELPSQTGGLSPDDVKKPYYGVFLAANDANNTFDLKFNNAGTCSSFIRQDNSVSNWTTETSATISDHSFRTEIISGTGALAFDLGPDKKFCDGSSFKVESGMDPTDKTFLWNTGETTPDLTVTTGGKYALQIKSGCKIGSDTIMLLTDQPPQSFSLGADVVACTVTPQTLAAPTTTVSGTFTWQDGSQEPTLNIRDFGTYWVRFENTCGAVSDTVHISKLTLNSTPPNVITPNGDGKNDTFMLETEVIGRANVEIFNRWGSSVYSQKNYQNTWNGEGLSPGVYFYLITSECFKEIRGPVSVLGD